MPRGRPAKIDGQLDSLEWADAVVVSVGQTGTARLKHDGRDLFISITGAAPLLPTICAVRGDTVRILHASASLGDAMYSPPAGEPRARLSDFTWAMRDGSPESTSDDARGAYFDRHGWIASTAGTNVRGREYRLHLGTLDPAPRIVIGLASLSGNGSAWPKTAVDDCANPTFAVGTAPATARFTPGAWGELTLSR